LTCNVYTCTTESGEAQLEITLWDLGEAAEDEDESFLGEVVLNIAKLLPFQNRLIEQVRSKRVAQE